MANDDDPFLSLDPRSWTAAQRAAVFGGASFIPIFPPLRGNPQVISVNKEGNISAPEAPAKPELVFPATEVDGHPCELLNLVDLLNEGKLPHGERCMNLGLISQVKARRSCPLCRLVKRGFDLASKSLLQVNFGCLLYSRAPKSGCTKDLYQLEVFAAPLTLISLDIPGEDLNPYFVLRIHCIGADETAALDVVRGRYRNREIDLSLAREWISHCIERHDGCKPSLSSMSSKWKATLKLIDVNRRCVIRASSPIPRYVALSYVWGPHQLQMFRSTVANTMEIDPDTNICMRLPEKLPPTIEDAIAFVKGLNETYLWVDSLCIVQDGTDKANQINQMDKVYAAALVTLVAAAGNDVNAGLMGVRHDSRSEQIVEEFQSIDIAILPHSYIHVFHSAWATRSWTYQEKLLSRRTMFFSEGDLLFICNCSMAREDLHGMKQIDIGNITESLGRDAKVLGNPIRALEEYLEPASNEYCVQALAVYMEMINQYTSKALTNAEDILRAVQGILNQTESTLGKYVDGIPCSFLEPGLLWQIDEDHIRREVTDSSTTPLFPSWSWAGWIGRVKYDSTESNPRNIQTKISNLQIIRSPGILEFDITSPLAEDTNLSTDRKAQDKHKCVDQAEPTLYSTILKFNASFATFKIKDPRQISTAHDIMGSLTVVLRPRVYWIVDAADKQIGEVTLSKNWAQKCLQFSVTFIALSMQRKISSPFASWAGCQPKVTLWKPRLDSDDSGFSFPPPLAEWETLNVMAVEQLKYGVFERRGLGAIHIPAWEAVNPMTRNFLLA